MRNVAIISVGYNGRFVAKRPDVNIPEMIQPAVANAIKKTKIKHSDIGVVVEGNMPTFEGINYPHLWFSDHIGAAGKPVLRISTGGTTGMSVFHGGYYCVASGMFDVAMVIGWEKHDEGDAQVGLMGIVLPEAFSLFQFGPDMSGGRGGGMGLLGGGGSTPDKKLGRFGTIASFFSDTGIESESCFTTDESGGFISFQRNGRNRIIVEYLLYKPAVTDHWNN